MGVRSNASIVWPHPRNWWMPFMALLPAALLLSACSTPSEDIGMQCRDGYVAHPGPNRPNDNCGNHGGGKSFADPYLDYLNELPSQPVVGQICSDGWTSTALGMPGSCSSHGGVAGLEFQDGTREIFRTNGVTIIKPDGTTRDLTLPGPSRSTS
jgi:hypothetical protein